MMLYDYLNKLKIKLEYSHKIINNDMKSFSFENKNRNLDDIDKNIESITNTKDELD